MHVTGFIVILLLVCMPSSRSENATHVTNVVPLPVGTTEKTTTTTAAPTNCTTVKNEAGVCTDRGNCDFGPSAIDETLYQPHWYKSPCNSSAVCCPFRFVMQAEHSATNNDDYTFDSDED